MVQSPGDHNSRGLKSTTNYTKNLFPRENYQGSSTYVLGACHLPWPSRSQGAMQSRAMVVLVGDSGGTTLRNSDFRSFCKRFLDACFVRLLQQKRKMCSRVPTYIAPQATWCPACDASHIGSFGLTSARGSLTTAHLTQAPEPRANPQGKDKLLNKIQQLLCN